MGGTPQKKTNYDNMFYEFRKAKDKFSPYYEKISKEQQLRLRKALLKSKEVIFKSK